MLTYTLRSAYVRMRRRNLSIPISNKQHDSVPMSPPVPTCHLVGEIKQLDTVTPLRVCISQVDWWGGGGGGGGGGAEVGGMLYADDAGVVSRSPDEEGLERVITAIVTACSAFGLIVSEAKPEIVCLRTQNGGKVSFTP